MRHAQFCAGGVPHLLSCAKVVMMTMMMKMKDGLEQRIDGGQQQQMKGKREGMERAMFMTRCRMPPA